jgi:pyruvate/2-oxoglutarate dehydrogenase complex dihydrolipoamide dehydrogenase (E3) component
MMGSRTGQEHGMDQPMDQPEPTDVVVIGMGPGGEYVAGARAEAGLHVTATESGLAGGECTYYRCLPSKMMIRAANLGSS